MGRIIILLLLAGALADFASLLQASRPVRISLRKDTSMRAGHLGQPITSYFARTEFGSPPKPFNMLIDVNAREVWLPHYLKMGLVYSRLNYKNGYSKKDSSTSEKEPAEIYKLDYNGCELSGKAYLDVVRFKDVKDRIQPVQFKQRFLAISSASNSKFTQFSPADGVLAFGPWPISETGSDLVSVSMRRANLTSDLKFGLALDSDSDGPNGGELTIGGIDSQKSNASVLHYHGLVAQHSWEVNLDSVMLGANSIDACPRKISNQATCNALLSTTTNDICGPTEPIKAMLKLLGFQNIDTKFDHSSLYEIDCLKIATAPTLTFVIDGQYYSIPPTSYIKKKEDGFIFKSSTCYVALLSNLSDNQWKLGTNFISNYYTVFDMDRRSVALGRRQL